MNIQKKLTDKLLHQAFSATDRQAEKRLETHRMTALAYARTENAVAVLSDMKTDTSYICYGGMAETLGLNRKNTVQNIRSIWEEKIFDRIHPDDLIEKHARELRFFHFLKGISPEKRTDYCLTSQIRMKDNAGRFHAVTHRMFYVDSTPDGSIWLALCLYNLSAGEQTKGGMITDSSNGKCITVSQQTCSGLLSQREKEILRLIGGGRASKEISLLLHISVNTVNRHRQNILAKLRAGNSVQAYQIAEELGLL